VPAGSRCTLERLAKGYWGSALKPVWKLQIGFFFMLAKSR